jgi:sugar phosphate isomerase/epimerase
MPYSRRELGKLVLAAVPAVGVLGTRRLFGQAARPDSTIAGVRLGLNVPYNFGRNTMTGEETLGRCLDLGVSHVELRSQPVEIFLGSPAYTAAGGPRLGRNAPPAEREAAAAAVRAWRTSLPVDRATPFRRTWNDAGVNIEIVKFDGVYQMSDEELEFAFGLARTLGARAISCEIALDDLSQTRRVGEAADRHGIWVGYHGHEETTPAHWEQTFSYAAHNGANLDIGHFVAGHSTSPVPFLREHHDRITHVHIKDRKTNHGPNMPFGEGDTPIVEVLQLIRDNRWNIQATIEFEYPIPEGSDRMTEIGRALAYCRKALES